MFPRVTLTLTIMTQHSSLTLERTVSLAVLALVLFLIERSSQESFTFAQAPAPSLEDPGKDCFLDDRCTLLSFKENLTDEDKQILASWNNETDVSGWKGVSWRLGPNGKMAVEKLELRNLGLRGDNLYPLMQEGLSQMTVLDISGNHFGGELPTPLHICAPLQVLDLSNNSFNGLLPRDLACGSSQPATKGADLFPNLIMVNFSNNNFTGAIDPLLLGSLSSIHHFDVSVNNLTGFIPTQLGTLHNLTSLALGTNRFTGSIPFYAVANLSSLEVLDLGGNFLNGTLEINTEGGGYKSLRTLNVSCNQVWGSIPPEIGNLSRLELLSFAHNTLTGTIPSALSKCLRLKSLDLQGNILNGTIPIEISQLSDLETLSLNNNSLTGPLHSSLENCSRLQALWLGVNSLWGSIPHELGNLTNLVVLSITQNDFNSSIPSDIGLLKNLVVLDLSMNKLDNTIPRTLCSLSMVQVMLMYENRLSGTLLDCMWNYTSLRMLDWAFNMLTGSLPSAPDGMLSFTTDHITSTPAPLSSTYIVKTHFLGTLYCVFSWIPLTFYLMHNNLSGEIPTSLGNFKHLQQLDLSYNSFSGGIPPSLGNITALLSLDLSHNHLSGEIPYELTRLNFLSSLNLSYNDLSGEIPESPQFETFQASSFIGNAELCGSILGISCAGQLNASLPIAPRTKNNLNSDLVAIPAVAIGYGVGFLGMTSTLVFVSGARRLLFTLLKLPSPSLRVHDRQYGLFPEPVYH